MKRLFLLLFLLPFVTAVGQIYNSQNIDLIARISPDTSATTGSNVNKYSGCWGWFQAAKNKEYAISGGRNGTYFIDITNPATPSVSAYVKGVSQECTWREVKTYQNYCYIASDVCKPNAFQIVDMQYLPDSVVVIHSDTTFFTLGHTLWIDQDKLYVASTTFGSGNNKSPLSVWSLADPEDPQLLRRIEQDDAVNEVHDMYVRNDTVYASAGYQGLRIYTFHGDTFVQLGSYNGYNGENTYNHSSFLTDNGKYLVFCDEVPSGLPIHLVDVGNFENIQPVSKWHPAAKTTPHNPYVIGNKWVVVSSYQDGLFIYDISLAPTIGLSGYFDTYHQGGDNTGNYGPDTYRGNWGAYPYLPSGIIIANDMQNGVFLLDAADAFNVVHVVGLHDKEKTTNTKVFPNPVHGELHIDLAAGTKAHVELRNLLGVLVSEINVSGSGSINTKDLAPGTYLLRISSEDAETVRKIIIPQ